jgi:predicted ABC-type ATPase
MPEPARRPRITVLAGVNGAGKSSLLGALLRERRQDYYNPDEETRRLLAERPELSDAQANSIAWQTGREGMERAIRERLSYAFETTLGGTTIPALLKSAPPAGLEAFVWFVGLDCAELHVERVRARVARGGHDISEERIRERYLGSRENLVDLLPSITALRLFDNSCEADPHAGERPAPRLILHFESGRIVRPELAALASATPPWARAVVAIALELALRTVEGRSDEMK